MTPINLAFNTYKSQYAKLPVDDFARSVEGFNQEYLKGVENLTLADQLARSIKVSEMDNPEKERRLSAIHSAIDQFSKTGNFEDAPIAATKLASMLRNDEWIQSAQERYAGIMADMQKANELDVSDAQRYALMKHIQQNGITPTQKNKLGNFGKYYSFDVFKEPNIQEELSKFMKDVEATYTQEITEDGDVVYVRGNEVKTKEDLLKLGLEYVRRDPKMSKLLQWEAGMYDEMTPPEVKKKTVAELKKAGYDIQNEDMAYKQYLQDQVLDKHVGHLAEAYAKDKSTITNLRMNTSSKAGSGSSGGSSAKGSDADYFGYTGRGSNIYIEGHAKNGAIASMRDAYKAATRKAGAENRFATTGDLRRELGKEGTAISSKASELEVFYSSPEAKSVISAAKGILGDQYEVASPETTQKSKAQLAKEIAENSINIPAPKIRLSDKAMKLVGVQEDEEGRPISGDNGFTLLLPSENGGGSKANEGNLQAIEEIVRKQMKGVEDVKFTYTKQGISPANPQGIPGAVVYTVTATGKGDNGHQVSMDFDMLRSNDNERLAQAFKPLQDMASFAYSAKPGSKTIPMGKETITIINVPTIGKDGTATITSMVTSSNPARKPMTFENFVSDYGMKIFNPKK